MSSIKEERGTLPSFFLEVTLAAASLGDCCCPGDVKVKVRSICLEGDLNVTLDDPGRAVAEKCNGVSTKKSYGKRRKIGNVTRVCLLGRGLAV